MKPIGAIDSPAMNGGGSITVAEDATNGDDDDVAEEVFAIACTPGIGKRLKVRADGFYIDEFRHEQHP